MKTLKTVTERDLVTMSWYYIGRKLDKAQKDYAKEQSSKNRVLLERWRGQEAELYERMIELESEETT